MSPYEREEKILTEQYERGEISLAEYNDALKALEREEQSDRQERAERAYREEYERY